MKNAMLAAVSLASLVATTGCHRTKRYEATVDIERMRVVRRDENGTPLATDVELSYRECPGDQDEVIRGGPNFSACMAKYKRGDKVKVKIVHKWDPEGHYRWDVTDVGDCKRTADESDEASYAMVRECEDWKASGVTVGFQCNIAPKKTLLKQCPWFAKR